MSVNQDLIIKALKKGGGDMTGAEIYKAEVFETEQEMYSALSELTKIFNGPVVREKPDAGGRFLYHLRNSSEVVLAPTPIIEDDVVDAVDLSLRNLAPELKVKAPPPKKTITKTKSVVHHKSSTVTETVSASIEVHDQIPITADIVQALPLPPQPEITTTTTYKEGDPLQCIKLAGLANLPALEVVNHREVLLEKLRKDKNTLDQEIQLIEFMAELGKGGDVAFALQETIDLSESVISCVEDEDKKQVIANRDQAKRFHAVVESGAIEALFKRINKQLADWAFVCEDSSAEDHSFSGEEARADAEECRKLITILGGDPTDPTIKVLE